MSTIWRTSLGIGVVFPLILLVLRVRLKEPEEFKRNSMKYAKTPYWLVLKFYGWRLLIVSLIWFIYDVRVFSLAELPGSSRLTTTTKMADHLSTNPQGGP